MAATVNKDYLFKVIRENSIKCYTVTDGKDIIGQGQEPRGPEEVIEQLNEIFENVEDPVVTVKLSQVPKKDKAGGGTFVYFEYKIRLKQKDATGLNGTGAIGYLERIKDLELALIKKDLEKERDILEQRLKKLEEGEKESPMVAHAMKVLELIAQQPGVKNTSVGVAGTNEPPVEDRIVEAQAKVRAAIKRLSLVDKNLPDTLTLLADFAEKKPAEYLRFIPMVKGML